MIGRDTIDRIRSRVDIVAIVSESVKLQQRGRSHVGLCPFHQEKSGSFSVSTDRQLFYCFGCKVSGDVFKFLELNEGLSFIESVKRLAERAGVEIVDERSDRDRVAEDRAKKAKDDLYAANAAASAYFEKMLVDHPLGSIARDELERRGLPYDGDMRPALESFGIGYAPHGWDGLVQYLRTCGISPAVAEQVGLLAPRSGGSGYYDAFRHRLMVAIKDVQGRIVAFSGRALPDPPGTRPDPSRDRGPPPKYVNSRESPIYSKGHTLFGLFQARNGIRAQSEAVIVEGNFDLVAMHARGIDHVVAPLGTAFTPDQARLLRRFAPAVVLLFDADSAGRKATWAARETCKAAELGVRSARLSEGKDPDEFLQAKGPEAMKRALHSARSLDEVLVEDVCESVGQHSNLAAKQAALHKIRPILEEQPPALREPLAKLAAKRLGIDLEALWRLVRAAHAPTDLQAAAADHPTRSGAASRELTEEDRLSRAIVEELLGCPELVEDLETQEALALVTGEWAFAVVAMRDEMRTSRQENRAFDGGSLLARLPPSIQDVAAAKLADPSVVGACFNDAPSRRLLATGGQETVDPVIARHKILDDARKLAKALTKARYDELVQRIVRAEASGDDDLALALALEKVRLEKELREAEARIRATAA